MASRDFIGSVPGVRLLVTGVARSYLVQSSPGRVSARPGIGSNGSSWGIRGHHGHSPGVRLSVMAKTPAAVWRSEH